MPLFRPGKPHRLLKRTTAAGGTTGLQTITWDSSEDEGDWSTSDLTTSVVERPGLYLISLSVVKATGGGSVQPLIYVNGVRRAGNTGPSATGLNFGNSTFCDMLELGDAITGRYAGFGASSTFDTDGTRMAIVRIGPLRWT